MQAVNTPSLPDAEGPSAPLTFITCGSVDDGKSTLIGRLLYDSRALMADQLAGLASSAFAGTATDGFDLSRATDGLEAEREQGITIDVAWRYFATPRRKFVIADTPGHAQYTRNMVTGASHAQAAVLLVDVTKLDLDAPEVILLEQTRRHAALVRLLGLPHVLVAINKMDAVNFDRAVFERVRDAFAVLAGVLGLPDWLALPVSALTGDGVTCQSEHMTWFDGPTLLQALESLAGGEISAAPVSDVRAEAPAWLPVQWSLRDSDIDGARWYCGRLTEGTLRVGEPIRALPTGSGAPTATVVALRVAGHPSAQAQAGDAVAVRLDQPLDIARGDWLTTAAAAQLGQRLDATLAWLDAAALVPGRPVLLRHGTRWVMACVERVTARLDLAQAAWSVDHQPIAANDIAAVHIEAAEPLPLGTSVRHARGRFLLIDPHTHATLAAGVVGQPFGDTLASAERVRREWAG